MTEKIKLIAISIIGILFMISCIPLLVFIGAILLFTAFDVVGFKYITNNSGGILYRIAQFAFQIILCYIIHMLVGWYVVIAFLVAWYLLLCDVLYYWVVGYELSPFSWFKTSPVVFYYMYIENKPNAPAIAVKISSYVGFIAGVLIIMFGLNLLPEFFWIN